MMSLRHVRRSLSQDKMRDAARLGIQSSAAAVATLVLLALIGIDQRFLGVISAVLVLDPSRDATIGNALQRIVATVIGTLVGGTSLLLLPHGQLVSMALVMLVMGSIAVFKPQWRYGLVAAAGLALGAEASLWATAADRTVAIFAGAATGISAGLLIWPKTSTSYAIDHLREALARCNRLLKRTIALAVEDSDPEVAALHGEVIRRIERASSAAGSIRLSHRAQKPALGAAIHQAERLWHALIILDRVSETKTGYSIVGEQESRQVRQLKEQCCEALSHLERLEPVADAALDEIDRTGTGLDLPKEGRDDQDRVERLGLAYGLHEVVRNIRELSNAIRKLKASAAEARRG